MNQTLAFTYDPPPGRVVFGAGSARSQLAKEVERLGAVRLLLITSAGERSRAVGITGSLGKRVVAHFDRVRPHVPVEVADAATAAAREADADLLVSVGGGSVTGTAKAVALASGLPILAVPTTYAGSEMTPIWGTTENGRKTTGHDLAVVPKVVLYDPELTMGLPIQITAASAMNAIAHCVEALYAPGRNPPATQMALAGISAISRALPRVVAHPEAAEARGDLLCGAYLAGSAFAVAGSGLHHKICHALGGAFNLPHAETHAIVLPHVVAFQQPAAAMELVATALDAGPGEAATTLYDLVGSLGLPLSLREIGMPADGIDQVVDQIVAATPTDNPRPVDVDAVTGILTAAYAGRPPNAEEAHR